MNCMVGFKVGCRLNYMWIEWWVTGWVEGLVVDTVTGRMGCRIRDKYVKWHNRRFGRTGCLVMNATKVFAYCKA